MVFYSSPKGPSKTVSREVSSLHLFLEGKTILILSLVGFMGIVLFRTKNLWFPFFLGFLIAYGLRKFVFYLEKWSIPRSIGSFLVLLLFFLLVGGIVSIFIPVLMEEMTLFLKVLPFYGERGYSLLLQKISPFLEVISEQDLTHFRQGVSRSLGSVAQWIGGLLGQILSGGMAIATLLSLGLITPVVAFYFLKDWPKLIKILRGWIPSRFRSFAESQLLLIDQTLSTFATGQLTICLILGTYYMVGLSFLGVNFGLMIGLLIGFFSFVPFVGFFLGFFLTLLVACGQYDSWEPFGLLGLLFLGGQLLEGNILIPYLVGNRIGLHPVWIIFALLAGFEWGGFLGIIFSIPLAAVLGVLSRFCLSIYLKSKFFKG